MKKLTAGIFTALLGLVTVNAANAAIPSTNYVEGKINRVYDAVAAVETAYKAADTALGTRIDGVESAYKAADSALDTRVTDLETTVGDGEMVVDTIPQADVIAAINALDEKTNGIASNAALETLQNTVSGHTTDISGLKTRMGTAEGDIVDLKVADTELDTAIKANTQAITDHATATTNALASKANTADLGALAAKNTVATSDLDSTLQDAVAQVATNKSNIESLNTTVGTKASQADLDTTNTNVTNLTGRVDTAESDIDALETKTAGLKSLAYQDIIDNSDITDGTIAQAKITDLTTDLAAKVDDSQVIAEAGTVTNADAEIPTIARMNAALDGKMPLTTTVDTNIGEDGTYVLTATTVDGTTTYKWELIERNVPVEN